MQTQPISGYRISQQQRQLWMLVQENSRYRAQCLYRAQSIVRLDGPVDPARLHAAVVAVIERHEILRTTFFRPPGMKIPYQVIGDEATVVWQHNSQSINSQPINNATDAMLRARADEPPFPLEQGPLLRATLMTERSDRHWLLLSLPALCADSWTLKNLVHEISQFYAASQSADGDGLDDEPLQYADYAEWQHELHQAAAQATEEAAAAAAYWQQAVPDSPATPRLPGEQLLPSGSSLAVDPVASETVTVALEAARCVALQRCCAEQGVTVAAFLLACWQSLLWRLTGSEEIVISYANAGRTDEDLVTALGPFAKPLPVGVRFDERLSLHELAWQVQKRLDAHAEHQEFFQWDRYMDATTKVPIGFACNEWPATYPAGDVTVTWAGEEIVATAGKLQLHCTLVGDALALTFYFDPASFAPSDIERLADQYTTLVSDAITNLETPIRQLALLSEQARQQLLVDWNSTATAYPVDQPIHHCFAAQAARTPTRVAVLCDGAGLTYAELEESANQLAHYLQARGVGPGTYVGLCVDRSLAMIVGLLGVLKAGGAYVPLNPDYPAARLERQLEEIGTPVLLTQQAYLDQLPAFAGEVLSLDAEEPPYAAAPSTAPNVSVAATDPVYVIFTSGSTGHPKGVVVRHGNLANYTHFINELLQTAAAADGLQFAMVSTITADLGNTCLFPALLSGGTLHVLPQAVATDGGRFASYMTNHAIDVLKIVPSHLNALLAAQPTGVNILPQKYLLLGGEALTWSLLQQIASQIWSGQAHCQLINHYGPTETTVGALTNLLNLGQGPAVEPNGAASDNANAVANLNPWGTTSVPIGRPIANTEIFILDEAGQPVPIGVPGELYIGGAGVAQGYLNQPERTAERFIANPFAVAERAHLYRTGDRVRYLPDGNVEFLGRTDNQVKLRGFRIELEEIEAILSRHSTVRQAVVVLRDEGDSTHPVPAEPLNGAARKQLVAYLVAQHDATINAGELTDHLSAEVPDYMIPTAFVVLDVIPLTSNGKVDRRALPAPETSGTSRDYVPPSTPTEQTLAEIWAQVLGRKQVGIHDNFFTDLGGDSILSIQIIARANSAGVSLMPKQIFEYQTIAALAAVAGRATAVQAEQGLVAGPVPLTPIQHWFFEQSFADPHHWNQSILLEVRQPLDPAVLEVVVAQLILHHDALRMRFTQSDGAWQQRNTGETALSALTTIDLSTTPVDEQRTAIEAEAAAAQAGLDLAEGPLVRFLYFDLGPNQLARLLIVVHHLVIDGVSWRILLEDLQLGYQLASQGEPISLPPKTTSFKAWATKVTAHAHSAAAQDEALYWQHGARQVVPALPVDFPGGVNSVATTTTLTVTCTPEETDAILHQLPELYHTQINDVLLTAVGQAVARWTGRQTLLVDLEGHGREAIVDDVDISRTVGWFTTHTPVLLQLGHHGDPTDDLLAVKEQLRAIPNSGIGYGLLRYLADDTTVTAPLREQRSPDIAFNYLGQIDGTLPETSPFGIAAESAGPSQSPRGQRPYRLYISGSIARGRLQLACMYSTALYRRATIEQLANDIVTALRTLIDHAEATETARYTPSDFGLADLDAQGLDAISSLLDEVDNG